MNKLNKEGKKHGIYEEYYSDGKLCYKGNYLNGKLHGIYESYYSNGKLRYKGNYLNGKLHGPWENYCCLNGNLDEIEYYIT